MRNDFVWWSRNDGERLGLPRTAYTREMIEEVDRKIIADANVSLSDYRPMGSYKQKYKVRDILNIDLNKRKVRFG